MHLLAFRFVNASNRSVLLARSFSSGRVWGAKKKAAPAAGTKLLGRPGNNLKGGIVGLANVGKSTFFQSITQSELGNPANYPFATIEPEEARVMVPSPRLDTLAELYKPDNVVPATLTVFDIAGLVKGASKGDGLGNAFLSHIRSVDGLFQVVRAFDDPEITHVEGTVDPIRDLEIILDELLFKDMEFTEKSLELAERSIKRSGGEKSKMKMFQDEAATAKKVLELLNNGKRVINGSWSDREVDIINSMALLTAKPSVYIVNVSEEEYISKQESPRLQAVKQWVQDRSPGDRVIPVSVSLEERLAILDSDAEREEELQSLGVNSALPEAIQELRKSLNLMSFFTSGKKEVREWTIRKGSTAPQAAGVIHNDLEKTFIVANVTKYNDVLEYGGDDQKLKSAGKIQNKGKDYIMEDGDVVMFKAGAARK